MKRTEAPDESTVYDFDKWARAQYSTSFQRKQKSRAQYAMKNEHKTDMSQSISKDRVIYFFMLFMGMFILVFTINQGGDGTPSRDNPESAVKK